MSYFNACNQRGCRGICELDRVVDGWGFGSCDECGSRRFFDQRFGRTWSRKGGGHP